MIESVKDATAPTRLQAAAKLCCKHNASNAADVVTPIAANTCIHSLLVLLLITIVLLSALVVVLVGGHINRNSASRTGKVTSGHDTARLHTTPNAASSFNALPSRSGSSPIKSLPILRVIGASVNCASIDSKSDNY